MKLTSLGVRFNEKCVGKFSRFLAEYKKSGVIQMDYKRVKAVVKKGLYGWR